MPWQARSNRRRSEPLVTVRRLVDLSHPLDQTAQVFPGDPPVSLVSAATVAGDGFNVLRVHIGSHSGTHLDAPLHVLEDGAGVDTMDLRLFCGPAVIADVRGIGARTPIRWGDLRPVRERLGPGVILLLHTDWSEQWGSETYFDHPYLHPEAAERVVAAGVRTVGIDAASLDETLLDDGPEPMPLPAHRAVLGAGGAIVENLTSLAAVDFPDPVVSALPLRLRSGDGSPVRAVAMQLG